MVRKRRTEGNDETPTKYSELPTPQRCMQAKKEGGGVDVTTNPNTGYAVTKIWLTRPIDYYERKGYIEDYHYKAAIAFEWDYQNREGVKSTIRSSLDFGHGSSTSLYIEHRMASAKERYEACMSLLDRAEKAMIHAVVFDDGYLKDLKGEWKTYGMLTPLTVQTLCSALDIVAEFYGLISKKVKSIESVDNTPKIADHKNMIT